MEILKNCIKAVHRDVKSMRVIVKNIDTSVESSDDEYTDMNT